MSGCHLWECQEICLNISGEIQLHCRQALQPLSRVLILPQEPGATPEGLGRALCRGCRHSCHVSRGLFGLTVLTQLSCLPGGWHGSLSQPSADISQCHHSLSAFGGEGLAQEPLLGRGFAGLRCWGRGWEHSGIRTSCFHH